MAFKINKSRLEFVVLMALAILSSPHLAALADPMKDQEHFRQLILNGICCVPNLSSGATAVHLKNGKGVNNSDRVTMGKIAVGELNGKPAAIAVISNQGGGSGIFVSLIR